jgi:hypothetical protein
VVSGYKRPRNMSWDVSFVVPDVSAFFEPLP